MEHKLMEDLTPTYGKTFTFWEKDKDSLPLGPPKVAAPPVQESMVKRAVVEARDRILNINTEDERRNREDIPSARILPGADSFAKGEAIVLETKVVH